MDGINRNVNHYYGLYKEALNYTDPRVRDYPLVWNDPTSVIALIIGYLVFVVVGKKVMKHLPEVHVPASILFIYNFGLVLLSIYMFEEIVVGAYQSNYNVFCANVNVSRSPSEMKVTNALWFYFISKAIELLDTFWMIIRKRFVQVTFLHVFHHSTMLAIWWIVISWIPGGQAYFGAALNSLVHVFMYAYYALSVIPSLKDKLWWKKYITTFQLVQFVFTLSHTLIGWYQRTEGKCNFPPWGQYLLTSYMVIMLILFSNFYIKEYIQKANEKKRRRLAKDLNNNNVKTSSAKVNGQSNGEVNESKKKIN